MALSVAGVLTACSSLSSGTGTGQQDSSTPAISDDGGSSQPDSNTVAPPPDSGGGSVDSGGQTGATDSGTQEAAATVPVCGAPAANSDTLPFAVDVGARFVPSGYEPTGNDGLTLPGDTTCGGNRSSSAALGSCHAVNFTPTPTGAGWAGVVWQHPANNWGANPGYLVPAGATKVSFWARGAVGGEVVSFSAGGMGTPSATSPCVDTTNASLHLQSLTKTWTHYTMPLTGTYAGGVLFGFAFAVGIGDQPADAGTVPATGDAGGDAGVPAVQFYIDDIQWQM